jgi:hypothetical protein|tara:strand:- start:12130 stop:12870 length:741 start_codon:yes stop_codon:yes gene_type:complete
MTEFKLPTEEVELPSKGLLYPKDNPLSSGKIEMKYMTAKEEDILTNQNYITKGIVIDKLLQSLIINKDINYNDLLIGDKNAIMVAARILSYGENYEFTWDNQPQNVNLSELKNDEIDIDLFQPGENNFPFTLPNTENKVTFKLLTHGDDKKIEAEIKGLKKIDKQGTHDVTTRLSHVITSINGSEEKKDIREFVKGYLLAKDARELRNHYAKISPDVDMKVYLDTANGGEEVVDLPIGLNFFWPDA